MNLPVNQEKENEDALIIKSGNPNRAIGTGKTEIINLTVRMKAGIPTLSYVAVWDESGHFGSGKTEVAFPAAVYRSLSPDAIADWLQAYFLCAGCSSADFEPIRTDPRLQAWCEKHKPDQAEKPFGSVGSRHK